jgi:hypothetical protein
MLASDAMRAEKLQLADCVRRMRGVQTCQTQTNFRNIAGREQNRVDAVACILQLLVNVLDRPCATWPVSRSPQQLSLTGISDSPVLLISPDCKAIETIYSAAHKCLCHRTTMYSAQATEVSTAMQRTCCASSWLNLRHAVGGDLTYTPHWRRGGRWFVIPRCVQVPVNHAAFIGGRTCRLDGDCSRNIACAGEVRSPAHGCVKVIDDWAEGFFCATGAVIGASEQYQQDTDRGGHAYCGCQHALAAIVHVDPPNRRAEWLLRRQLHRPGDFDDGGLIV